MTIIPNRSANPKRTSKWKWGWVFIFVSFFIGISAAGFFSAGYTSFLHKEMIWYGTIVAGIALLGFRFKKAAGIPLAMILIAFIVYFSMMTSSFSCPPQEVQNGAGEEYRIGRFSLLDRQDSTMRFEIGREKNTAMVEINGQAATPVVSILQISDKYILFGGKTLYIFHGMYPHENIFLEGDLPKDMFAREESTIRYSWIGKFAERLPGIELEVLTSDPFLPVPFQRYTVFLVPGDNPGLEINSSL